MFNISLLRHNFVILLPWSLWRERWARTKKYLRDLEKPFNDLRKALEIQQKFNKGKFCETLMNPIFTIQLKPVGPPLTWTKLYIYKNNKYIIYNYLQHQLKVFKFNFQWCNTMSIFWGYWGYSHSYRQMKICKTTTMIFTTSMLFPEWNSNSEES